VTDANDVVPTFDRDIKPQLREGDRSSMLAFFDLWSFDDVKENAWRDSRSGSLRLYAVRRGVVGRESRPLRALVEPGAEP
jgi:hypothetical protein